MGWLTPLSYVAKGVLNLLKVDLLVFIRPAVSFHPITNWQAAKLIRCFRKDGALRFDLTAVRKALERFIRQGGGGEAMNQFS
jgi:hypothetical protein